MREKKISVFWEDSIFSEVAVIGKDGTKQTKTDFFFDEICDELRNGIIRSLRFRQED